MKDILVRAVKTFVQAALAAWALSGNDLSKGALIGAAAAGISAAWNAFLAAKNANVTPDEE
jgi:hypothetical protein